MAITTWSDFKPYITFEVPAAPDPLIEQALRQVAIRFCDETALHVVALDPIDVVAGTAQYSLVSPLVSTDVSYVRDAWFTGHRLEPASLDDLRNAASLWRDLEADNPTHYVQETSSSVTLYRKPSLSVTDGLKIEAVLRPTLTADGVTDWIAATYVHELAIGAKALLMAMPGQPWSNPDYSLAYRKDFEAAVTAATVGINRANARARPQIKLKRF